MKGLLKFFTSPRVWMHLILIVIFGAVVLSLTMFWLDNYTRHGDSIIVPDLRGVKIDEIDEILTNNDLKYEINPMIKNSDNLKMIGLAGVFVFIFLLLKKRYL